MPLTHSLVSAIQHTFHRIKVSLDCHAPPLLARLRHPKRRDILLALAAPPSLLILYILILIPFTPSIRDIRKATSEQPAQILFADGKKLTEFKVSNRVWVKLADISPHVVAALIATEDHRFYEHSGLDWRRTAAAAFYTLRGDRQGGSTLTQQLARNLYPEEVGRDPTLTRKLKEAITAFKIETIHSKAEILETYLNTVPFLYNAYGIEMAARTYFDTSASALNVLESATLVGMLKGNSYYNPVLNPERALQRRNTVLTQLVKHQKLSAAQYEVLQKKPLRIDFERQTEPPGPAPHFAQRLRQWLIDWADRNDYNLYSDGLVIHTTLDSRQQALANQAVMRQGRQLQSVADATWGTRVWNTKNNLIRTFVRETPEYRKAVSAGQSEEQAIQTLQSDKAFMQALRQQKTTVQAGFIAIDPHNGHIKAWVGSRDFQQDAFDHVQQARRQPGSTFKPFVYGEAFRQDWRPEDTLVDQAVEITLSGGEIWRPTDSHPPSGQAMTLRDGLIYSKNTLTAQLMQQVGPAKVAKLARALGVRQSKLEAVPSLALGTSPVSLQEMVSAYGTLANGGGYLEPVMVTRIEDRNGRLLAEFTRSDPEPALPPAVAYTVLDVLRGVIDRGTGSSIRNRFGIRADVAGKTGTTQENADGWFILMHPQLVGGAWVGFNDNRVTLGSDYWGQGAHSALPIVGHFFANTLRVRLIDPRIRFKAPDDSNFVQRQFHRFKAWLVDLYTPQPTSKAPPQASKSSRPIDEAPPPTPDPEPIQEPDRLQEIIDQVIRENQNSSTN